jgi:AcrR family transcriptional regulator
VSKADHEAIKQKRAAAVERRRSIRDQKIAARDQKIAEHKEKVGLREQKKRDTRQHISDVATEMFLKQGFDSVRVSDVAEACGVSEKTVFNYFPTKESLALDQIEPMTERLRAVLGPGATKPPVEATVDLARETIENLIGNGLGDGDIKQMIQPFIAMIESTPALAAARDGATKLLTDVAAESLAERYGRDASDADIHVASVALVGFWDSSRMRAVHHAREGKSPAEIRKLTRKDLSAAAKLLHQGFDDAFA